MGQKNQPQPEYRRMTKDELSRRLHALQATSSSEDFGAIREKEHQAVLHELEVYQIELEMQNRELRESREALEESYDRYVNLYDFSPLGYVTFDKRGVMKELNLTFSGMLGVERGWLVDKSLSPWLLDSDLPIFRKHMKRCETEERVTSTLHLVRKDKQVIAVELLSVCSKHPETGESVLRTTVTDVTEKKELENELLRSLGSLKEERKLREIFVSTLTHDLRTPLAAVKMGTQLIKRNPSAAEENSVLADRVLESIERMDIMIHDLLDANRIRAGEKLSLNIESCDLVALTKKTLEVLTSIHGNRFKLEAPETYICPLDPMGMRRVIENLCSNAIKYGDPKTPISVAIKQSNNRMLLSIHNEGMAIPRKDHATLFNQFQRTDSAQTGGKKGWGVGLTLIRGLVEAHGGCVRLESELGKGTTFIIELPVVTSKKTYERPGT